MRPPDNIQLPPHYYRDNFLRLCDTVETQYGDILSEPELGLLQDFRNLPFAAQCLYLRLVMRVGPWFREGRLAYVELGAVGPLVDTLLQRGMAELADDLPLAELGKLYTRGELQQVFNAELRTARFPAKGSLLSAIEALGLPAGEATGRLSAIAPERIIGPLGLAQVQLLQLLFFGNRRQSLTEFVLSDLGVARYYPYPLDRDFRLFPGRQALEEYLQCAALSDAWYELREAGEEERLPALAQDMLCMDITFSSSEGRWYRLCNAVARQLERQGQMAMALELYARSLRHPARERRARLLERAGDWAGALQQCEDIIAAPWCEDELEAAGRIRPRVKRKLDGSRSVRRRDEFPALHVQLPRAEGAVEIRCAEYLADSWAEVTYVENKLMNALFGLAFWEQIFAPLPGAFHNAYQSVPADMYQPVFRERRREILDARLAQLANCDLVTLLGDAYRRYTPLQCRWIDWRRIDAHLIEAAAGIIPARHLLAIWQRMLFDPGENRKGFPDLIALGEDPGDYCLIEVKGPGDTLQDSQKRWLRFFGQHGITAQVAWVKWRDD
jgi:hypothetical protein